MKNHIDSNFAIAIIVLVSACLGFAFWMFNQDVDVGVSEQGVVPNLNNVEEQLADSDVDSGSAVLGTKKVDQIFAWLPPYQRMIASDYSITPSKGNILVSSILSPDKRKIVYAEISDCFHYIENVDWGIDYNSEDHNCDGIFDYRVLVKDINTDEVTQIYQQRQQYTENSSFMKWLIPTVHAGGAPTYGEFPIGWSADSTWVFTKKGMLLTAATGGGPDIYMTGRINVDTAEYEELAKGSAIFSDDYRYMIYARNNPDKPLSCGWGGPFNPNYLDLVLHDFDTGKEQYLYRSEIDEIVLIRPSDTFDEVVVFLASSTLDDQEKSEDRVCIDSSISGSLVEAAYKQESIIIPKDLKLIKRESDFETLQREIDLYESN